MIIVTFYSNIYALEKTIFTLSRQNPSFAIHGARLARLKQIHIIGCEGCDFLVDFTQRDCQNLSEQQNKIINTIARNFTDYCLDPWPFFVDGQEPRMLCDNPMSYTPKLDQQLYLCSMRVEKEGMIKVEAKENVTLLGLQFALSFRVTKWVNDSQKAFVIPASLHIYTPEVVFIPRGYLPTLVANPDLSSPGYFGSLVALYTSGGSRNVVDCKNFEPDITCTDNTRYSAYYGSDPGLTKDEKDNLMDIGPEKNIYSRTTSTSIFANQLCSFCLVFVSGMPGKYEEQLDYPTVFTSFNYPWELDDPSEYPLCQQFLANFSTVVPQSLRRVLMRIDFLEGGTLRIQGSYNDDGSCHREKPTEQISFTEPPKDQIHWKVNCIALTWCPDRPLSSDSFGFVLRAQQDPDITPDDIDCVKTFYLTDDEPQFISHSLNIQYARAEYARSVCVRHKQCDMGEDCRFLVDIPLTCTPEEAKKRSKISPVQINGGYPELENCTIRHSPNDEKVFITCQTIIEESFVALRVHDTIAFPSAVSVRAIKAMDDSVDSVVIPSDFLIGKHTPDTVLLSMKLEASDLPLWISFIFPRADTSGKRLQKLRSDHTESACEYKLVSGPPLVKDFHPERELMTFKDPDPFIPQFIETILVSVLVPAGCTPSLSFVQAVAYSGFIRSINLCDGTIIMESLGYQNPFEFPIVANFSSIEYRITCNSYRVNISVEVISIGNGHLELDFLESNNDLDSKNESLISSTQTVPFNVNKSNMTGLVARWRLNPSSHVEMIGCLLLISFNRSIPPSLPITTIPPRISPTYPEDTNVNGNITYHYHYYIIVSILFMSLEISMQ
ncbi:unnamed protein product, partial [Mesorhabditis belari]|uniref:Uncharacterized protein n=1 Tax=Mesorhabditis belari TaxID=2138241 RepID=A0AAF3FRV9_9BILA